MNNMEKVGTRSCQNFSATKNGLVNPIRNELSIPKPREIWKSNILWQDPLSKREYCELLIFSFWFGARKLEMGRPNTRAGQRIQIQ